MSPFLAALSHACAHTRYIREVGGATIYCKYVNYVNYMLAIGYYGAEVYDISMTFGERVKLLSSPGSEVPQTVASTFTSLIASISGRRQ